MTTRNLSKPAQSTAIDQEGQDGTDLRKHSSLTGPGATMMTISGISSVETTSVSPGTQHSSSDNDNNVDNVIIYLPVYLCNIISPYVVLPRQIELRSPHPKHKK